MEPGKGIPGFMRKSLPALEPECLLSKIKRSTMDKQHSAIRPFHGHGIKEGKKGGAPHLLMTVSTCRITSAYQQPVEKSMIVVAEYRNKPVFSRESMDHLKSFLRTVSPMNKIPEIY
jgi:hypothetical protein